MNALTAVALVALVIVAGLLAVRRSRGWRAFGFTPDSARCHDDLRAARQRIVALQQEVLDLKTRSARPTRYDVLHELPGVLGRLEEAEELLRRVDDANRRAEAAEARARHLEERLAKAPVAGRPVAAGDAFKEAKKAFARLCHPDRAGGAGGDEAVRAEIFKVFWAELEQIEKRAR